MAPSMKEHGVGLVVSVAICGYSLCFLGYLCVKVSRERERERERERD